MSNKTQALKRRIAPGVSLALDLRDDDGSEMQKVFRLTFDYNALALIHERTGQDSTGQKLWLGLNASSLSLIFWTLVIVVSVKYALVVMRADNRGEGGILALMSLIRAKWHGRNNYLIAFGLIGAALLYGDGMITPAISVLSASKG